MSLRVLQHHLHQSGLPATSRGGNGPFRAVACHDTEGETGEQGAWNTLSWMVATAADRDLDGGESRMRSLGGEHDHDGGE